MCLSIRADETPVPQLAAEDIHVIKLLQVWPAEMCNGVAVIESPFMMTQYFIDEVRNSWLNIFPADEFSGLRQYGNFCVSEGLHTFGDIEAYRHCMNSWNHQNEKWKPYHAIIPMGSLYLVGNFEGTPNCYVSNLLKVTGPVDTEVSHT